jgi:DNA-binding MarR family transcriptional regulator
MSARTEHTTARLDALRDAFDEVFAAQRRLRGRDAKTVDGISFAQFRLLRMLSLGGPMPSSRLAATLGLSPASVTQMLDGLERRGLVDRSRSEHDRRVVTVALTAEGRRRAEARRAEQRRVFEAVFAGLSDEEVDCGLAVLERCADYLDAL